MADVAIYNGSTVNRLIDGSRSLTFVTKTTEIVDLETNTLITVSAVNVKLLRKKEFVVFPAISTTKAVVKDRKNVETTIFTFAKSDVSQVAFGSFTGTNTKKGVKIKTGAEAVALPTSLKASGTVLNLGANADSNDLTTVSGVLKLSTASSLKANALTPEGGQTLLDAAVKMVTDALVAQGYSDNTPIP